MDELDLVRSHVIKMLQGGQAFDTFDEIVGGFSFAVSGMLHDGIEHSAWQIVSHIVFAQRDILDFCLSDKVGYIEKSWPEDYWPKTTAPTDDAQWRAMSDAYHADLHELESLVKDDANDLFAAFPWGDGQTLFRQALLVAEHTAYHLGQLVVLQEANQFLART